MNFLSVCVSMIYTKFFYLSAYELASFRQKRNKMVNMNRNVLRKGLKVLGLGFYYRHLIEIGTQGREMACQPKLSFGSSPWRRSHCLAVHLQTDSV